MFDLQGFELSCHKEPPCCSVDRQMQFVVVTRICDSAGSKQLQTPLTEWKQSHARAAKSKRSSVAYSRTNFRSAGLGRAGQGGVLEVLLNFFRIFLEDLAVGEWFG